MIFFLPTQELKTSPKVQREMDRIEYAVLAPEEYDKAIDYLEVNFYQESVIARSLASSAVAVGDAKFLEERNKYRMEMFAQGLTLVARDETTDKIVGLIISTSMAENRKNQRLLLEHCARSETFQKMIRLHD